MYRRKCAMKGASALGMRAVEAAVYPGVAICRGADIESCRKASGKLGRRAGNGRAKGRLETGEASSNRSSTTRFGSVRVEVLNESLGLPIDPLRDCALMRLLLGDDAVAYSGSSAKLSGVTMTP